MEITLVCKDKSLIYYKCEIFKRSVMIQNLCSDMRNVEINSIELPFYSEDVICMFNYYYSVGWIGVVEWEVGKIDLYLRIVDIIDFFDFNNKKDLYDIIGKHINVKLYEQYGDLCYHNDIKLENDFKNCIKFLFQKN